MKQLYLILILIISSMLINTAVLAEQTSVKPQTQGDVSFVSGGVGSDERNELQNIRADYNLKLLFSIKGTGEYLSDVKVRIEDSSGAVCLETVSEGPMLFVKLKPGNYNISADESGYQLNKKAAISTKKTTSLAFAWAKE